MTLDERIDAAIKRITSGQGPMRIPADPTDPDLVLAECRTRLAEVERERDAALAAVAQLRAILSDIRDVMRTTGEGPDATRDEGWWDPRRPIGTAVWRVLDATDLGAGWVSPERVREVAEAAWNRGYLAGTAWGSSLVPRSADATVARRQDIDALLREVKP